MTTKCPKCSGEMEEGISVADVPMSYRGKVVWGTKLGAFIKNIDNQKDITTFRCQNCGYLESYAK